MRRKNRAGGTMFRLLALLAVGGAYLAGQRAGWEGPWLGPSDGADTALAIGASFAAGNPFALNAADPSFPWATDPLYALVAAVASRFPAGASGNGAWAWLFAVNLALLGWTLSSLARAGAGLVPAWLSFPALLAAALSGPLTSAFFSLDGTGLFVALVCALWASWLWFIEGNWRALAKPVVLSLLLSLTGPSGALVALATAAVAASQSGKRHALPALLAGAVAPCAVLAGYYIAGFPWPAPGLPVAETLRQASAPAAGFIHGLWTGMLPSGEWGPASLAILPGALFLVLVALVQPGPARPAIYVTACLGLSCLLSSALGQASAREPGWISGLSLPFIVLLGFSGIGRAGEFVPEQWRKPLGRGLAVAWILSSLPGLASSMDGLHRASLEARDYRHALRSIPPAGGVLSSRPGLVRRFSSRASYDLTGTRSPWLAPAVMAGWGGWYDLFKGEPDGKRPRWVILRRGQDDRIPTGFLTKSPDSAAPQSHLIAELRWRPPANHPRIPGWQVVDELDCGLARSEMAHGYDRMGGAPDGGVLAVPRNSPGDGGWKVSRGESFTLTAHAGKPLVVLARIRPEGNARIAASLNGFPPDLVPVSRGAADWQEVVLVQSGADKVGQNNRVVLTLSGTGQAYSSFHYWAFQPEK